MAQTCTHLDTVGDVSPSSEGCEDCLRIGGRWVHLRMHAVRTHRLPRPVAQPSRDRTHHEHNDHPLIRSYEPGEDWQAARRRPLLRGRGRGAVAVAPLRVTNLACDRPDAPADAHACPGRLPAQDRIVPAPIFDCDDRFILQRSRRYCRSHRTSPASGRPRRTYPRSSCTPACSFPFATIRPSELREVSHRHD